MPLLETVGITRRFGDVNALSDVCLRVRAGSIFGFLGPNGAGKTTLIRIVLGLIRPTAGQVRLFGRDARENRCDALRRTGSLVESPSLYGHLTGHENLEIRRRMLGLAPASIARALEVVGLNSAAGKLVRQYSLGMRQRLGSAQALLASPELLILDEPTNGLDPAGIREMRDLLRRMPAEHGVTVFLSSHLLGEVEQVATHIGILSSGRVLFQGTQAELREAWQGRLHIRCDRNREAAALLERAGFSVDVSDDGIEMENPAIAPESVNRMLVEAGFAVSFLAYEKASLEQLFLHVTEAA